jgi:uncharacterized protein YycO
MGFLDDAKGMAEKAKNLATEHADQVQSAVQKVGDVIDEKTGEKYKGQIDKGQQFVADHLGKKDEEPQP